MKHKNVTTLTMLHLLGFQTPYNISCLVFFLLLLLYCVTMCGNLMIIIVVSYSKALQSPMYFFLSQLSVSDILLITDIHPNTFHVLLREAVISFSGCLFQLYVFLFTGTLESLLLTVMCYDRYLAICRPLHYPLAMSFQICWILILTCWILSVSIVMIHSSAISQLQFCGLDVIDHFFCDLDPILQLSCSDTTMVQLVMTLLSSLFGVIPFYIIIISYIYIIITIFQIPSVTGRQKVFSTCSAHLTVVCVYYGTLLCVYLIPKGQSWNITKFLSLLYTVGTPLMNPIIYSLRNKDLKIAADKILNHCFLLLYNK